MVSAAASDFVPSPMPDVDPATGLNYTFAATAGGQLLLYKVLATAAVTFTQCFFYKWRKWQIQRQQQREQEEQQEQTTALAIYQPFADDNSPLGFDFDRLEVQDDHRRFYQQLLADNKKMKQRLREQETAHAQEIQRMQVGKDTNNETHYEDLQRLKQQLREKQIITEAQDKKIEQAEAHKSMDKRGEDPLWERSKRGDEDWKEEPGSTAQTHTRPDIAKIQAPSCAIGTTQITKAIDQWIDDYKLHGGIIADRNCVDGRIVTDWGLREIGGQRCGQLGSKGDNEDSGYKSNIYFTPTDRIRRAILLPDTDSSPERDFGEVNNLRNQIVDDGDDFGDEGDDDNGPGP